MNSTYPDIYTWYRRSHIHRCYQVYMSGYVLFMNAKQKWYGMIGLPNNYKSSYILVNLYGTSISRPFPSSIPFWFRASSIDSMMNIPLWFFLFTLLIRRLSKNIWQNMNSRTLYIFEIRRTLSWLYHEVGKNIYQIYLRDKPNSLIHSRVAHREIHYAYVQ